MFKKLSPPFLGFLQASSLVAYIYLITLFFNFVPPLFKDLPEEYFAPIIMLLLFITSAVISALLVLGRAGVLFWDKKYKEAFKLVVWTVFWQLFYFVLFILVLSAIA